MKFAAALTYRNNCPSVGTAGIQAVNSVAIFLLKIYPFIWNGSAQIIWVEIVIPIY